MVGEEKRQVIIGNTSETIKKPLTIGIPRNLRFALVWTLFFAILGIIFKSIQEGKIVFLDFFTKEYIDWFRSFGSFTKVTVYEDAKNLVFSMIEKWYYFFFTGGLISLIWASLEYIIHFEIKLRKSEKLIVKEISIEKSKQDLKKIGQPKSVSSIHEIYQSTSPKLPLIFSDASLQKSMQLVNTEYQRKLIDQLKSGDTKVPVKEEKKQDITASKLINPVLPNLPKKPEITPPAKPLILIHPVLPELSIENPELKRINEWIEEGFLMLAEENIEEAALVYENLRKNYNSFLDADRSIYLRLINLYEQILRVREYVRNKNKR